MECADDLMAGLQQIENRAEALDSFVQGRDLVRACQRNDTNVVADPPIARRPSHPMVKTGKDRGVPDLGRRVEGCL
jgi:hypothetical protein